MTDTASSRPGRRAAATAAPDESPDNWYNPDQDEDERRRVRINLRENAREFQNRRDELMRPDNYDLLEMLQKQENYMQGVRQTADAAIDSRFLVAASDLTLKKTKQMTLGGGSSGIDVDEFVSKCVSFMRKSGERRNRDLGADGEEDSSTLPWHAFGALVCRCAGRRPATTSHLLGPLSVQKRVRPPIVRRAIRRNQNQEVSKPQELTESDLSQSGIHDTPTLCRNIRAELISIFTLGMERANGVDIETMPEEEAVSFLSECKLSSDFQVPLLRFALNPQSYGQTVENLFYISFMVKDGGATLGKDTFGLPTIRPVNPSTAEERKEALKQGQTLERHQVVLSLDWPTWKQLVSIYGDGAQPWITHRTYAQPSTTVRGWYG